MFSKFEIVFLSQTFFVKIIYNEYNFYILNNYIMSKSSDMQKMQNALTELKGKDVSEELIKKFDEEEKIYFEKSLYENLLVTKTKKLKSLSALNKKINQLEEEFTELYADELDVLDKKIESEEVLDYDDDDEASATEEVTSMNKIDVLNKLRSYKLLKVQLELEKKSLEMLSEQINNIEHKI